MNLTTADALKPFIIQITGPLIRIIGDRFPPEVKSAILQTLGFLLDKAGMTLKPFLPQLQTIFIKALYDPSPVRAPHAAQESRLRSEAFNQDVRTHAANALGKLMTLQTKADTLVAELVTAIKNTQGTLSGLGLVRHLSGLTRAGGVQEATVSALQKVLSTSATPIDAKILGNVGSLVMDLLDNDDGSYPLFSVHPSFLSPLIPTTTIPHTSFILSLSLRHRTKGRGSPRRRLRQARTKGPVRPVLTVR